MNFPVLQKVDQEFLVRFVQRHVVEKSETMPHSGRFVHKLPNRHATVAFGLENKLEQELMIGSGINGMTSLWSGCTMAAPSI